MDIICIRFLCKKSQDTILHKPLPSPPDQSAPHILDSSQGTHDKPSMSDGTFDAIDQAQMCGDQAVPVKEIVSAVSDRLDQQATIVNLPSDLVPFLNDVMAYVMDRPDLVEKFVDGMKANGLNVE